MLYYVHFLLVKSFIPTRRCIASTHYSVIEKSIILVIENYHVGCNAICHYVDYRKIHNVGYREKNMILVIGIQYIGENHSFLYVGDKIPLYWVKRRRKTYPYMVYFRFSHYIVHSMTLYWGIFICLNDGYTAILNMKGQCSGKYYPFFPSCWFYPIDDILGDDGIL